MGILAAAFTAVLLHRHANLCTVDNISQGSWHLNVTFDPSKKSYKHSERPRKELTFVGCPKTFKYIEHDHQRDYGRCSIFPASYIPDNCKLLAIQESTLVLRKYFNQLNGNQNKLKIQVIGDSLGAQLDVGGRCMIEMLKLNNDTDLTHIRDQYLRNDYPCLEGCSNKSFAEVWANIMCFSCRDGIPKPYSLETSWYRHIDLDTNIVVLNSGAWYNGHLLRPTSNFEKEYTTTLRISLDIATKLAAERNITVVWTPLPPLKGPGGQRYSWDKFESRNERAKKMFAGTAIHYIDINSLIRTLRKLNPSVDFKGDFHFCNPSPSSVLSFLYRSILSLLVAQLNA